MRYRNYLCDYRNVFAKKVLLLFVFSVNRLVQLSGRRNVIFLRPIISFNYFIFDKMIPDELEND